MMFAKLMLGWRALVWRKAPPSTREEKLELQRQESIFKTLWRCWDL